MSRNQKIRVVALGSILHIIYQRLILKKGMIDMNDYAVYRNQQNRQIQRRTSCADSISPLPSDYAVAMLYVPMQTDLSMFEEMKALECGTLFCVLNKPFAGKCCR